MSEEYSYKAKVTLVVEVEGVLEDDGHTVIEDQIRDQAIDDAGLTFRDDDIEVSSINYAQLDGLYPEAVRLVREEKRISVSFIQRSFKLGYNRAANIIERMEKEGIISSMDNRGSRFVLSSDSVN